MRDKNKNLDGTTNFFRFGLESQLADRFVAHLCVSLTPTRGLPRFWRLLLARRPREPPLAKVIGSTSNPIDCASLWNVQRSARAPLSGLFSCRKKGLFFGNSISGTIDSFEAENKLGVKRSWSLTWTYNVAAYSGNRTLSLSVAIVTYRE